MVTFRKPKSLSEYLVRASFRSGSKDEVKGTSKCNSNRCQICNFLCLVNVKYNKLDPILLRLGQGLTIIREGTM